MLRSELWSWVRGIGGRAVWSVTGLAVPALAVLHDRHVAQAIALYTLETVLAVAVLRFRLARVRRGLPWDDAVAARLREAGKVAQMAGIASLALGFLVLAFYVAFDVRPDDLFDVRTWKEASFDRFGERLAWMTTGLALGAILDTWFAPVRSPDWLESAAAWLLRRVAAPAVAYLPGAALTAWSGTSAGFLWPWFLMRAFTDLTALNPGERQRVRQAVLGGANGTRPPATGT